MYFRLYIQLYMVQLVITLVITVTVAEDIHSKKNLSKKEENDDAFIDDEDSVEGSGHGKNKYDLESSGSGDGLFDEDDEHNLRPNEIEKKPEEKTPIIFSSSTTKSTTALSTFLPTTEHRPEVVIVEPIDTKVVPIKNDFGVIDSEKSNDNVHQEDNGASVYKDKTISFFAQPGILVAIIGGAVVGLLCSILVVMFIVYRIRKKDEGSYALEEMKKCLPTNPYDKPIRREFFA